MARAGTPRRHRAPAVVCAAAGLLLGACADSHQVPERDWPSIAAGDETTCVLLRDGAVACWGRGWRGQLGDGLRSDSATPVRVSGLSPARRVSLNEHACALDRGGQVLCWGPDVPAEGLDPEPDVDRPEPQPFERAIDVLAGSQDTCVLSHDGRVRCLGSGGGAVALRGDAVRMTIDGRELCTLAGGGRLRCYEGSLDDDYHRVDAPVSHALDIARGPGEALVLARDGRVHQHDDPGDWTVVEGVDDAVRLGDSAGQHACAVLEDGGVACWGLNTHGQLGNGERSDGYEHTLSAVRVAGLDDAVAVAAGRHHSCAIRRTGAVVCWGANHRGQLGTGGIEPSLVPVEVAGLDLSADPSVTAAAPMERTCLEADGDGDGLSDRYESSPHHGGSCGEHGGDDDGVPPAQDEDSDGDGLADVREHAGHPCEPDGLDCDGDGVPSFLDRDADNDGVPDGAEEDAEAACTRDADGDACPDVMERELGGCRPQDGVLWGSGSTEVVLPVAEDAPPSSDVELAVGDYEPLRGEWPEGLEPATVGAVGSDDGDAVASGAGFRDAAPGEALRFELDGARYSGFFGGDTRLARSELSLRDGAGRSLATGTLLTVLVPVPCVGP